MNTPSATVSEPAARAVTANGYRLALILVTSLFFLWGFSYGLLDVLNKHFQETLGITKARSAWLQAAYFGAYFLMAMPAATLMARHGYKAAILSGLCLFAAGAMLVIPSTLAVSFPFFLGSLFVIASGLAFLETAANPYVTQLGDPARSERRLNMSQSFNGLGQFTAPLLASSVLFPAHVVETGQEPVRMIYAGVAIVVLIVALLTWRTAMPEVKEYLTAADDGSPRNVPSPWAQPRFAWGVVAQFCYVAAQVCIGAFFINYVTEQYADISSAEGARLLSYALGCFLIGRFVGTALMSRIAPETLLTTYAIVNIGLGLIVVMSVARLSIAALLAIFFFMSIMFPTIFALAVKRLGPGTKRGSSYLIMSIVGGAIVPYFMGWIADVHGIAPAFILPVICFAVVAGYGWKVGSSWRH